MENSFPQELWRKILSRLSFREQTKLVILRKGTTISSMSCNFEDEYHATQPIQERDVIRMNFSTTIPVLRFFKKYCPNINVVSSDLSLTPKELVQLNHLLGKYSSQLKCINIPHEALGSKKKPNLIHVRAHSLTKNSFQVLATKSKFLTSLILERLNTEEILLELRRLPKGLKQIKMNFQGKALPEGFLKSPAMKTIESITLLNVLELPVTHRLLPPRLKSLHLQLTSTANEMQSQCIIRFLSYLTQLEELTLNTGSTMFPLDSDDWKHLCQSLSVKLRVIVIKGNLIPGKLIPDLVSRCPLVQQLDIKVYVKVEEEDLLSLKELTKLEKLHVTVSRPNTTDPVGDYPSHLVTWKRILSFLKETKSRDTLRDFNIFQYYYPIENEEIVDDIKQAVQEEFELMKDQHHLTKAYAEVHGGSVYLK